MGGVSSGLGNSFGYFGLGAEVLGSAFNTYSNVKADMTNANLADAQAEYYEKVTAKKIELLRKKSAMDMRALRADQEAEYAHNRVNAVARGNAGASASAFFSGSLTGYARQRNELALAQNTETLNLVIDGSFQANNLRATADAYRERAMGHLIAGAVGGAAIAFDSYTSRNAVTVLPDENGGSSDSLISGGFGADDPKKIFGGTSAALFTGSTAFNTLTGRANNPVPRLG